MKKRFLSLLVVAFVLFSTQALFAEDTYYEKGDTKFSFTTGVTVPLYLHFWESTSDHEDQWNFFSDTNIYTGGYGAISFEKFYSSKISIGGEFGYSFNYDEGSDLYYNIPLMAKVLYYPIQSVKYDGYLFGDLGITYNHYTDENSDSSQGLLSPYISMGVGGTYYFNENWGLGMETGVTFIPQISIYDDTADDNGTFATIPIMLKVSYRN